MEPIVFPIISDVPDSPLSMSEVVYLLVFCRLRFPSALLPTVLRCRDFLAADDNKTVLGRVSA